MAKKVQKPASETTEKPYDVNPIDFMVITIDVDFGEDLANFIKKKRGTGMIAEFGEHLLNSARAQQADRVNVEAIEEFAATADKYVKEVDKQVDKKIKLAAAKSAKAEKVKRERLAKKAKQLHAKGKSFRAIGKALGVSAITAARYCKK